MFLCAKNLLEFPALPLDFFLCFFLPPCRTWWPVFIHMVACLAGLLSEEVVAFSSGVAGRFWAVGRHGGVVQVKESVLRQL